MLVTTKGRYAMRLMVYLAHFPERKIALREVAESEGISFKYLEQLAHAMVSHGLLNSVRGHGGGYTLARAADDIRAGDILRAAERTMVAVTFPELGEGVQTTQGAPGAAGARDVPESPYATAGFWMGLNDVIADYIDSVTLADLIE